jgi:hypothetical protein
LNFEQWLDHSAPRNLVAILYSMAVVCAVGIVLLLFVISKTEQFIIAYVFIASCGSIGLADLAFLYRKWWNEPNNE